MAAAAELRLPQLLERRVRAQRVVLTGTPVGVGDGGEIGVAPGADLLVLVDHRPAVPDIRRNAEETGNEVVSSRETDPGVWEMVLRKG